MLSDKQAQSSRLDAGTLFRPEFLERIASALAIREGELFQIASQDAGCPNAVAVKMTDFASAKKWPRDSHALPHRLVTANESLVRCKAGHLQDAKLREIRECLGSYRLAIDGFEENACESALLIP